MPIDLIVFFWYDNIRKIYATCIKSENTIKESSIMLRSWKKLISVVLGLTILLSTLSFVSAGASSADEAGITDAAGWFESAYAEWSPIVGADSF